MTNEQYKQFSKLGREKYVFSLSENGLFYIGDRISMESSELKRIKSENRLVEMEKYLHKLKFYADIDSNDLLAHVISVFAPKSATVLMRFDAVSVTISSSEEFRKDAEKGIKVKFAEYSFDNGLEKALKSISKSKSNYIVIKNYGIMVSFDSIKETVSAVSKILKWAEKKLSVSERAEELSPEKEEEIALLIPQLRMLTGECKNNNVHSIVRLIRTPFEDLLVKNAKAFRENYKEINYDQLLMCGTPLYIKRKKTTEEQYSENEKSINDFIKKNKTYPRLIVIEKLGIFALGNTSSEAEDIGDIFTNAVMCSEKYGIRSEIKPFDFCSLKKHDVDGTVSEKIVIVTGGAQGFGEGISRSLLEKGANVVIADLNIELAETKAKEFETQFGRGKCIAIKADVSNDDSVKKMIYDTAIYYGGLDCIVSNAGIARSGSLEEMSQNLMELHMKINYIGFFLCSKYASRIMKIQYRFNKEYFADIIQINSKSGLVGSNKNFAYAGSKFGGVGLTQSFALELVEYNIKVNSICPGNYFDGPLWSDPVKGLFKLYMESGKVPGAKTVEDVKRFYEAKIPMRKGCVPADVAKAIIYCIEQLYETGQAIPVTGGQVMLK